MEYFYNKKTKEFIDKAFLEKACKCELCGKYEMDINCWDSEFYCNECIEKYHTLHNAIKISKELNGNSFYLTSICSFLKDEEIEKLILEHIVKNENKYKKEIQKFFDSATTEYIESIINGNL